MDNFDEPFIIVCTYYGLVKAAIKENSFFGQKLILKLPALILRGQ
jgi:hypothetical protein